jgi:hypothetical protein
MNAFRSKLHSTLRRARGRALAAPLGLILLALTACSGTAVVTMTSTPSTDNYLAYRVGLVSVQLQSSGGASGLTILPASTTVDFSTLTDVSEVLGAAPVTKGNYKTALITLDYTSAQIVYDDGSVNGVTLTPVGANGQALGQVLLTVTLDPSDSFSVTSKGASLLAINFNMAASNVVNLAAKTVTVTPLMAASAMPIDTKQVRIRGPLVSVANTSTDTTATASSSFLMGVMPFASTANGTGRLAIVPTDATAFEVNGVASTGSAGLGLLAALNSSAITVAYGTLTSTDTASTATTTTTTADGVVETASTSSTDVTFAATQVLAGSSVQGSGLDRISGIVAARSGDTLSIEDGTLIAADGTETFIGGTTTVLMGANTLVTTSGQTGVEFNTVQQVSVGSAIAAFGVATIQSTENATLDASAGHIRLDNTTASGLVTAQTTAQGLVTLNLNLTYLGGRTVKALNLGDADALANPYSVATSSLDLTNSTTGAPVIVTGLTSSFGTAAPNFYATTLLDPTTINAELVVDWGTGTATPFTTYDTSAMDVDVRNTSIGARHEIQIGAQVITLLGLSSDPMISPDATSSAMVFTIGHGVAGTMESFNTYPAFITQLQTELTGKVLATGMTAVGQYTASSFVFEATSITVFLNN